MMRLLYTLLLYLVLPLVLLRLLWRGIKSPAYWQRWNERFGFFKRLPDRPTLWIHAVSVGETQAAQPLVRALMTRYPDYQILITTMTPTGSQQVRQLFGDSVQHVYAPYDLPGAVRRFLRRSRPRLALIMETEMWPNLFTLCRRRGIPLLMVNARMSPRSTAGYKKLARFTRYTLAQPAAILAQSAADGVHLVDLGAQPEKVHITGSIKFDVTTPQSLVEQAAALRRIWGVERPVWIAASTHEGEDELILEAFDAVRGLYPRCLLVLVPRHPERFAAVAALCQRAGYHITLRSAGGVCDENTEVFVGDTMGELPLFYAASDVAFVGGSLVPTGGHNPLEPAALGIAVLFGPHMFNFAQISRLLLKAGAALQVNSVADLERRVRFWLHNPNARHEAGEQGRRVVEKNRGALEAVMARVAGYLEGQGKDAGKKIQDKS